MRRRAVVIGKEPTQKIEFLLAESRDLNPTIRAGNNRTQNQQQHFIQWVTHFALLAGIIKALEVCEKIYVGFSAWWPAHGAILIGGEMDRLKNHSLPDLGIPLFCSATALGNH